MGMQWHYSRDGHRAGPVSSDELKSMARDGSIRPSDLVWRVGMPQWIAAAKVKGLFAEGDPAVVAAAPVAAPVAVAAAAPRTVVRQAIPVAPLEASPVEASPGDDRDPSEAAEAPAASAIGYFSPTSGVPQRVRKTLAGFPSATGSRNEWPIDDSQMIQLIHAAKHRKTIRGAAMLFRAMFALCVIGVILIAVSIIFDAVMRKRMGATEASTAIGTQLGFGLLYLATWKSTLKCQRWAPLTMSILYLLTTLLVVGLFAIPLLSHSNVSPAVALVTMLATGFLPAIFAIVAWRAFAAVPKFLASPMWCQEAIVSTEV